MLATPIIREILRLLLEGKMTQRQIEKAMNVERHAVRSLANMLRQIQRARQAEAAANSSGSIEAELLEPFEPFERCPDCGGTVHLPCRHCAAEQHATARRRRRREAPKPLGLELRECHRLRYEAIRALRRNQPEEEIIDPGLIFTALANCEGGENSTVPSAPRFNPDDTGNFDGWFEFSFDSSCGAGVPPAARE